MTPDLEDEDAQREHNYMGLTNEEMNEAQIGNYIGDDTNMEDFMDSF